MVGLLDVNQLNTPSEPSPRLKETQAKPSIYSYIYVDNENLQKELLTFLKGAEIWMSILGDDMKEIGAAILQGHDVLATVQDMVAEFSGLDQGFIKLNFFTPSEAAEKEWNDMKGVWGMGNASVSGDAPPSN